MSIKTIIVDDEPHARRYLGDLLLEDQDLDLVAFLKNGREALNYLSEHKVDLVFLDIHMPGINGLEVLQNLPKHSSPYIIFTTAYDQYAITAFEAEALDYLLKPFDNQRLIKSITKVKKQLKLEERSGFHQKIVQLYQDFEDAKSAKLTEFIIKEKGFEKKVKSKDILWIASSSVYAELHTLNERYLYRVALSQLETELPETFLRIHRSIILNTSKIRRTQYLSNNTYKFHMSNGQSITSSRSYKPAIMKKLSS